MANARDRFEANIKRLLAQRPDLSQTQFAESLGRGASWISDFLKGRRRIGIDNADKAAEFFGVDISELFVDPGTLLAQREAPKHEQARVDLDTSRDECIALFTEEVERVANSLIEAHATAITTLIGAITETSSGGAADGGRARRKAD